MVKGSNDHDIVRVSFFTQSYLYSLTVYVQKIAKFTYNHATKDIYNAKIVITMYLQLVMIPTSMHIFSASSVDFHADSNIGEKLE